jgi:putative salt-induced outer membrane protein YdiY
MEGKFVLRKVGFFAFIAVALSSFLFADQVTLKNGDRLTGKVVKSDGKTLVLHTDSAGDVTVKYADVQEIKTEQELHVTLKSGRTAVGPVSTTDGKLEIATKTEGTVEAPQADVTVIRDDAEQADYDKSQHPTLTQGWKGGANVGFSIARGNSETENLALAFNAVHPTIKDKITLYANSVETTNNLATPSTVANLTQGGFRYDRNFDAKMFAFGAADYMSNALQYLDLRQVYTGGFGYHAIKSANTMFNILAGGNYTHETYSNGELLVAASGTTPAIYESYGMTHRYAALTLGEELNQKLGKNTVLTQNAYVYPDLSHTGNYRANFNLGTVTKFNKWLGWQNSINNIFVSNPPTGSKTDDIIFTTGLSISFAH